MAALSLATALPSNSHCGEGRLECYDLMLSVVSAPGVLVPGDEAKVVVQPQFPPAHEHTVKVTADDFVILDSTSVTFAQGSIQRVELKVVAKHPHVGGIK